jgi:hypothetical protein
VLLVLLLLPPHAAGLLLQLATFHWRILLAAPVRLVGVLLCLVRLPQLLDVAGAPLQFEVCRTVSRGSARVERACICSDLAGYMPTRACANVASVSC